MVDEKALYAAATAALNARRNANGWPATTLDKMLTPDRDAWIEDVQAAVTAYLRALSPGSTGETEGWQDIASAPKDGTRVLVWDGKQRKIVWWETVTERISAWIEADLEELGVLYVNPTHWRPLPAPPSAMLSAAGER